MKTWIQRTLIGAASAAVLLAGIGAYAAAESSDNWQPSAEHMAKMRTKMLDRASSYLELDANQKQLLSTLADKMAAQRQALMGTGVNPRSEFQGLVAGPAFDRAGAQALVDAKADAVRSNGPAVIAAAADFYDALRPDQQQKVRDFMNKRHGRHHHG